MIENCKVHCIAENVEVEVSDFKLLQADEMSVGKTEVETEFKQKQSICGNSLMTAYIYAPSDPRESS